MAQVAEKKARVEGARERGYKSFGNTPEYKRLQRERVAASEGRELQRRDAVEVSRIKLEKQADQLRRNVFRQFLFECCDRLHSEPGWKDAYLAKVRDRFRERYKQDPQRERSRVQVYKHANPERVAKWQGKRGQLEAERADGSLTRETVVDLFAQAKQCPYCGINFAKAKKALDHMNPLSKGGAHSKQNVLICCDPCNFAKHANTFDEWLARIAEPFRSRCQRMYRARFNASPRQVVMALPFMNHTSEAGGNVR